jgi:uncharacterized protein (DUF1330 family)
MHTSCYKVAFAIAVGICLSAAAVEGLHAQAQRAGYVVANVKNPDGYMKEFLPSAAKAIAEAGGKYVVRGGKTVSLQGEAPPSRVVVLRFESMDKAQTWYDSLARRDSQAIGDKYATIRIFLVEGDR